MKFVIQRVKEASVKVDDEYTGKIKKGYLVLIGVGQEDTKEEADKYIRKMINLRIFEDENGKTNCSLKDVDGELLLVSQFTLYASSVISGSIAILCFFKSPIASSINSPRSMVPKSIFMYFPTISSRSVYKLAWSIFSVGFPNDKNAFLSS